MDITEALEKAAVLKKELLQKNFPITQVILFGSVAKRTAHKESDVDIAVVSKPFKNSRIEENAEFLWARKDIDLRIETVCLHPEDMDDKYSTLVQEVKKYGIPVE
jgi:uncharacterized protein